MTVIVNTQNQDLLQQAYTISKEVFAALGPLDQIAVKALEEHGYVRIVDENKVKATW